MHLSGLLPPCESHRVLQARLWLGTKKARGKRSGESGRTCGERRRRRSGCPPPEGWRSEEDWYECDSRRRAMLGIDWGEGDG